MVALRRRGAFSLQQRVHLLVQRELELLHARTESGGVFGLDHHVYAHHRSDLTRVCGQVPEFECQKHVVPAPEHLPTGATVVLHVSAKFGDREKHVLRGWFWEGDGYPRNVGSTPAGRSAARFGFSFATVDAGASGESLETLRSSRSLHATTLNTASALRNDERLSSCRFSNAHPVLSALKNSSIVQRARYASTIFATSASVRIGSLDRSIHEMGATPSGGVSSLTHTTLSRIGSILDRSRNGAGNSMRVALTVSSASRSSRRGLCLLSTPTLLGFRADRWTVRIRRTARRAASSGNVSRIPPLSPLRFQPVRPRTTKRMSCSRKLRKFSNASPSRSITWIAFGRRSRTSHARSPQRNASFFRLEARLAFDADCFFRGRRCARHNA